MGPNFVLLMVTRTGQMIFGDVNIANTFQAELLLLLLVVVVVVLVVLLLLLVGQLGSV